MCAAQMQHELKHSLRFPGPASGNNGVQLYSRPRSC